MAETRALLPPTPEHPLLEPPNEEKLREEVERLRRELDEERKRNSSGKKDHQNGQSRRPERRTLWWLGAGIACVLILAFFFGFLPHYRREKQLRQDARNEAKELPVVTYVVARRSAGNTQIVLPGNIEALTDSPVLARADGYLKKRYADIGDRVKAGQLLAEVAAPDLDQQVQQARAQLLQANATVRQAVASLDQAHATQSLSKVTAERWAGLLRRGAVSPQDNDTQQANYRAQTANVVAMDEAVSAAQQNSSAAHANLDRLIELQGYEQIRAPFSGLITLRNIDVGALIGNNQTLLFRIAQTDVLRTFLNVPESGASMIQPGQKAVLNLQEYPGRQFTGQIVRTSKSLDPGTRTLLTEVDVPNSTGILYPGMFAEVVLNQSRSNPPILIPADALIVRANGTFVAVLEGEVKNPPPKESRQKDAQSDKQDGAKKKKNDREEKAELAREQQELPTLTVHLQSVSPGRDYGNAIEVLTGLNDGDRIVESPNDQTEDKAKVKGEPAEENPVTTSTGPGAKQNANGEKLAPQSNAEPAPRQPSKENMKP
ncbi:MAG TPA: efflux RND transporter periplasmic adaptor subunit [Bryobacteraceae bacterium]|jgi:RND family efflux transporter MFP subunit